MLIQSDELLKRGQFIDPNNDWRESCSLKYLQRDFSSC